MNTTSKQMRIAAVSDLHCTRTSQGAFGPLFQRIAGQMDLLLLCGDLTDHGLPEEARVLAGELAGVKVPMLGVLGNHDYHSDHAEEVERILEGVGLKILDGDDCEIHGVGFAGVKRFAGGFGRHTLEAWGEPAIKKFVYESVEEALKLEKALARLHTPRRVAVLHYAPIQATVEGEPPPIYPFLGSSRLEEPINRYGVMVVFHGHAHRGSAEGRTQTGIPVYNVSLSLMREAMGDERPFRFFELPAEAEGNGACPPAADTSSSPSLALAGQKS
jgi:Icc-related predicted phosphoesterase